MYSTNIVQYFQTRKTKFIKTGYSYSGQKIILEIFYLRWLKKKIIEDKTKTKTVSVCYAQKCPAMTGHCKFQQKMSLTHQEKNST